VIPQFIKLVWCLFVFRAVSILPNRIIGTVGEHPGFPIEALSLSHCGQWLASCSHDQLVKFSDVREVLSQKVDGHKRLKRIDQRKVLSSKAATEQDFFGDLDPDRGESFQQAAAEDGDSDSSDSESDDAAEMSGTAGKLSHKSRDQSAVEDAHVDDDNNEPSDDDINNDEDQESSDDDGDD